jgi:hypothetical protein
VGALSTNAVGALSTDQIVALTSNQVGALSTNQFSALSSNSIGAIETADVGAIKTAMIAALKTSQTAGLTTDQIGVLSTSQVAALSTTILSSGLSTDQAVALTSSQVAVLSSSQAAALSTAAVAALSTADVAALKTGSLAALTTSQVKALTTDQIVGMTSSQFAAITTNQVQALTTDQLAAIETGDLRALKTSSIAALSTAQISKLTTDQIHSLTSTQVCAITSSQVPGLTTDQIAALPSPLGTPIVLDLSGNGINTLAVSNGVQFDVLANGNKSATGWVGQGNGLLVLDRNGDGTINDGSELFGAGTTLANGQKATSGYQALAELDTNGDGVINSKDADFSKLEVWVDSNADGVSQPGELKTLTQLGITQLNLDAKQNASLNNGNIIGATSTFETADGQTHEAADVWFQMGSMSNAVGSLTQAMASYGGSTTPETTTPKLDVVGSSKAVNVAAMADAMKQFDANGQPLGSTLTAASDESLRLKALQNSSANHGFLAAPK